MAGELPVRDEHGRDGGGGHAGQHQLRSGDEPVHDHSGGHARAGAAEPRRLRRHDEGDFKGRSVLAEQKAMGVSKRCVALLLASGRVLGVVDAIATEQCELRFHRLNPHRAPEVHQPVKGKWAGFRILPVSNRFIVLSAQN